MKTVTALLIATFLAGTAHAQATRADVKSEARDAVKKGEIVSGEQSYNPPRTNSTKTRTERKTETKVAIANRELPRLREAEEPAPSRMVASGDRPTVKAETRRANKAGEIPRGEMGSAKN